MSNLILTGFMGTGKSTVGRAVAKRLGRPFVDMDAEITARAGKPIPRIFAEEGEAAFRHLEAELAVELAQKTGQVIATGGGTLVNEANRAVLLARGVGVCLRATPTAILKRLQQGSGGIASRPLLNVPDPEARVAELLAERKTAYDAIPWQVDTTARALAEVVEEVLALSGILTLNVQVPGGSEASGIRAYPIHVGKGILPHLGDALHAAGVPEGSLVALVSNPVVAPLYAATAEASLSAAGYATFRCEVHDGEQHKTLDTVRELYEQFLAGELDRSGTVLALGGGVTGDIAGFAAATYMRGVRFGQVPTSLLAMTDASVGGKTGVDLPQGKNLVGAFKQPALVFIDVAVLETLASEEMRSGMAEMLKHGVIADPGLFAALAELPRTGKPLTPELLARSIRVKIAVVEDDPLEKGRRAVLNLGHTVGHALERLSDFEMRHGEAVAIGMVAAARIAEALGRASSGLSARIATVLRRWELPTRCPPVEVADILQALTYDKKRRGRNLRWVLPLELGKVELADDVPLDVVRQVLVDMGAATE